MALKIIVGDVTIGVKRDGFSYIFSAQTGGLESLRRGEKEWLYRTPKPAFWRAATDNDKGNGFAFSSAMWMGADAYSRCVSVGAQIDGQPVVFPLSPANNQFRGDEVCNHILLSFMYETPTVPAAYVKVNYEVEEDGRLHVSVRYLGREGLPELPVFGMRFIMPTAADSFCYQGLSGETYPDRMAGGIHGIYHVEGLPVTPYLVPQDCGVHMETEWLKIARSSVLDCNAVNTVSSELCFRAEDGSSFAFSALPYTPLELENATHQEELPPVRRTVVSILGAVRGVGGIDSWGANVEEAYRISGERDIAYGFWIE